MSEATINVRLDRNSIQGLGATGRGQSAQAATAAAAGVAGATIARSFAKHIAATKPASYALGATQTVTTTRELANSIKAASQAVAQFTGSKAAGRFYELGREMQTFAQEVAGRVAASRKAAASHKNAQTPLAGLEQAALAARHKAVTAQKISEAESRQATAPAFTAKAATAGKRFGVTFGKTAGMGMTAAIGGALSYMLKSSGMEKQATEVGSMFAGAAIGAKFGPMGMAAGAVVGAGVGKAMNALRIERERTDIRDASIAANATTAWGIAAQARQAGFGMLGGHSALSLMKKRAGEVAGTADRARHAYETHLYKGTENTAQALLDKQKMLHYQGEGRNLTAAMAQRVFQEAQERVSTFSPSSAYSQLNAQARSGIYTSAGQAALAGQAQGMQSRAITLLEQLVTVAEKIATTADNAATKGIAGQAMDIHKLSTSLF